MFTIQGTPEANEKVSGCDDHELSRRRSCEFLQCLTSLPPSRITLQALFLLYTQLESEKDRRTQSAQEESAAATSATAAADQLAGAGAAAEAPSAGTGASAQQA